VRIERFDPMADEDQLRSCYEVMISGRSQDDPDVPPPSFGMFRGWWGYGFAGDPRQTWLATSDAGEPLGCYLLELPDLDNRANGFLFLLVGLQARRQGVGTALVAHAAAQAEQAGRTLLLSDAREGAPGVAFAAAAGARPTLRDARRVLDVGPALRASLAGLRAEAEQHATGYTLRRWTGSTPEDLVSQVAALNAAMEDAPHEESFEPLTWDSDRVRRADHRLIIEGVRSYSMVALHDASAEMAALTQMIVEPSIDGWAFQDITAVTRKHRGHRLGLLVKVAMLEWLAEAEAQVSQIMTFNAVANEHMIAVNDKLGHRVTDFFQGFEIDVAAAKKVAGATKLAGHQ
jgi:GNAT superfamily N-acetyltransferase/RimJ/RimL family protein N-acetyltransferase